MRSFTAAARNVRIIRTSTPMIQPRYFNAASSLRVRHTGQSPEELEKKKDEQVKKQEQGNGEWHESLASSSESHVKADQEKVDDHDEHIEDLQKETAKQAEKEK